MNAVNQQQNLIIKQVAHLPDSPIIYLNENSTTNIFINIGDGAYSSVYKVRRAED